jgi:hypothetical protein
MCCKCREWYCRNQRGIHTLQESYEIHKEIFSEENGRIKSCLNKHRKAMFRYRTVYNMKWKSLQKVPKVFVFFDVLIQMRGKHL